MESNCNCNCNCNCTCNCRETDNNCTREELMNNVRKYNFAITELALYLNTHPCDENALALHREYAKCYRDAVEKYQKMYGPLTIFYPCNRWRWLENPWPWEGGSY